MDTVMYQLAVLILLVNTVQTAIQPQYGEDFILFPSQDGSNNLVPAFLTKTFTKGIRAQAFLPTKADIHFYLYTQNNRDTPIELFVNDLKTLEKSKFSRQQELKIICHGFSSSYINPFPANTKNKYLEVYGRKPVNVIVMDWSLLAVAPFYIEAVEHVSMVGSEIGNMLKFLVDAKYITLENVHFIGHSLGAHIGGVAARIVSSLLGKKLGRITGLDPASPLVEGTELSLSRDVAIFVDVVHTDGQFLGIASPLGVADFYPNGGLEQKGCVLDLFGQCSHTRAHEYFLESIVSPASNSSKFGACLCTNCQIKDKLCYQDKFLHGQCNCTKNTSMGDGAEQALPGLYFLETNPEFPFSKS